MRWVAVLVVSLVGIALGVTGLLLLRDDGPAELLPDLAQAAPVRLEIVEDGDSYQLVFTSGVANVGTGPLLVEAERPGRETSGMTVRQLVRRTDGSARVRADVGELRYAESESEGRWRLVDFAAYELRRAADGAPVRPGQVVDVCLGDRARADAEVGADAVPRRPVWTDGCGPGQPGLLVVREGISPGYGMDDVPDRAGPFIDVTNVPAGRYVLVQKANPERALEESDYANNTASVLIQVRRAGVIPSVRVLARCPGTDVCRPR
jgi:Lysyl oxidase